jgi:hypothetical protein
MVLHRPVELAGILGNWLFGVATFRELIRTYPGRDEAFPQRITSELPTIHPERGMASRHQNTQAPENHSNWKRS